MKKIALLLTLFFSPFFLSAASPDRGNGIIIDSVATDFYYGETKGGAAPSLKHDLSQQEVANANIIYAFPDFGYLTSVSPVGDQNATNTACPANSDTKPDMNHAFIYFAMPQLSDTSDPGTTVISSELGTCVSPSALTQYYQSLPGIKHVVPMIYYDDGTSTMLNSLSTTELINFADAIVKQQTISDPNAYGFAIDNEGGSVQITQSVEVSFFGELASALNEQGKYLFLFDAPKTARDIYSNHPNVVILDPLYDLTGESPLPDLNTYKKDVATMIQSATLPGNPPFMLVLSASASDTLYDYTESFNAGSAGNACIPPTDNSDPIAYTVLTALLSQNDETLPQMYSTCKKSTESSTENTDTYFSAALSQIAASSPSPEQYLGAVLYSWRIPEFYDISCGSNFSTGAVCKNKTFPPNITDNWTAFKIFQAQNPGL